MTRQKTHKQLFATHPVPGQSRTFVYVYVFFLSLMVDHQSRPTSASERGQELSDQALGNAGSDKNRRFSPITA